MAIHRAWRPILAVIAALQLGACATVLEGTNQTVTINTGAVPDVDCTLTSPGFGSRTAKAPGVVTVEKSRHDISVHCRKEGYEDGQGVVKSHFAAATAGNIVFGLSGIVVGGVIDAASGAANKYDAQVHIVMVPRPEPAPPESKVERRGVMRPSPVAVPGSVPAAATAPAVPSVDTRVRTPLCREVGGYEEYKKRTGEVCQL